ncbi:MAG: hypothetical protein JKY15_01600 [Deltaproteobacteria bacterium]|nr:hypothetical protein [Deltaproteobacteria bacterium]
MFILLTLMLAALPVSAAENCTEGDQVHFYKTNRAFAQDWKTCGKDSWGYEQETSDCIREKYEMTDACGDCFGMFTSCAASNCWGPCAINPFASEDDCRRCAEKACMNGLASCTGVSKDKIPAID